MTQSREKWNEIVDASTRALAHEEMDPAVSAVAADFSTAVFAEYVVRGQLPFPVAPVPHKKALEFFFSYKLLDPQPGHHVLDLAGGRSAYLHALRLVSGVSHVYLNDHIFAGIKVVDGISVVGGDAGNVQLPDGSLDRIACHHAFEHFQGETDSRVIRELARLLKPGGRACLVPLFLTTDYIECWNIPHEGAFDAAARVVLDPSASIPGGDEDGHFARFYDLAAVKRRVLDVARDLGLRAAIAACRLDGRDLPDMKGNFGSILNYPMRALVLEKPGMPAA